MCSDLEGVAVDGGVAVNTVDTAVGDVGERVRGADDGVVTAELPVGNFVDLHLGGLGILGKVLK